MIAAAIEEFQKNYTIINMHVSTGSADIGDLLGSSDALWIQRIGDLSELQLDRFAEFEEMLRDYIDIWRDIEVTGRRKGGKTLQDLVDVLKAVDVSVSFGMERMGMRFGTGAPMRVTVLYVAAAPGMTPMLGLVREKNMPISFA